MSGYVLHNLVYYENRDRRSSLTLPGRTVLKCCLAVHLSSLQICPVSPKKVGVDLYLAYPSYLKMERDEYGSWRNLINSAGTFLMRCLNDH